MNTKSAATPIAGPRHLWIVFWIKGVLLSHLYFGLILFLYRHINTTELALLLVALLMYTASILRAIWRDPLHVGNRYWLQLARAITIAWALNALLVSVFLFLEHIGKAVVPF